MRAQGWEGVACIGAAAQPIAGKPAPTGAA